MAVARHHRRLPPLTADLPSSEREGKDRIDALASLACICELVAVGDAALPFPLTCSLVDMATALRAEVRRRTGMERQ